MRHRNMAVHVEIPGRLWNLDMQSVHFLGHDDLAAQPAGFGQAPGHVQHVLLVFRGLLQEVVEGIRVRNDHVTSAAGADALAGALQLDVVPLGDLQHRFSHVGIAVVNDGVAVAVHKGEVDRIDVIVIDVRTAVPPLVDGLEVVVIVIVIGIVIVVVTLVAALQYLLRWC